MNNLITKTYMKLIFKSLRPVALLLAVGVGLAVPGCQLEEMPQAELGLRETLLTIQATYQDPESETKTVLHSDAHVYWVPGDAISLFYGSGTAGGSKFTAQATEETRVTNFSGKIGVVTGGDEIPESATYFWGLYPYDPTASCDGEFITMNIKSTQIGAPDTFASGFAPSLGRAKGLMLAFRNIYTGITFNVTNPGYQSVTFRSNKGELIAGRAKIGVGSDNTPYVSEILEGTSAVTVSAPTADRKSVV